MIPKYYLRGEVGMVEKVEEFLVKEDLMIILILKI